MEALASVLTRERLLAELVVFKLVELRGLLQSGEVRFLGWAAEEVERATTSLREAELQRAALVTGLAAQRGLPDDVPLSALLADVPEPWRGVLGELADRLRALCLEARELSAANSRLADTGLQGVEHLLGRVAGPARSSDDLGLYGPGGRREARLPRTRVAADL